MKKVVLVFGHAGWIGRQLVPVLVAAGFRVADAGGVRADDADAVAALLDSVRPHRVVSVIGRTRGDGVCTIDYLEDEPKSHDKLVVNLRDNLFAPMTLALACAKRDVHFTYLGTGCIFSRGEDGADRDGEGFSEGDAPNFFGSAYSVVKGYTDRLMQQLPGDVLQARIRMPITADRSPHNFVTKITTYARICSAENSMTVLPTLLPCLADMILRGTVGTVNLTNPGTISHDRILEMYRDVVDPGFAWTNFSEAEQDALLRSRRSNNRLDTARLTSMYPAVPGIEAAIATCLESSPHLSLGRGPHIEARSPV